MPLKKPVPPCPKCGGVIVDRTNYYGWSIIACACEICGNMSHTVDEMFDITRRVK